MFPAYLQQLYEKNFDIDKTLRHRRFPLFLEKYKPQQGLTLIKIAGTNGKGSVACMLESCFLEDAKEVGLFTSPHLYCLSERIRVNGKPLSLEKIEQQAQQLCMELTDFVAEYGEAYQLSFFECLLIIALRLFKEAGVKLAILEAGIGGYHDATYFLNAPVSAITSIGLDHPQQLGETLEKVAMDKAGVACDNSMLVIAGNIEKNLQQIIRQDGLSRGVTLKVADNLPYQVKMNLSTMQFKFKQDNKEYLIDLPLLGDFQLQNFSVVAEILTFLYAKHYLENPASIQGVKRTRWPGRMEYFAGHPSVFFDVAHNPEAIAALTKTLDKLIPKSKRIILCGFSEDKNYVDCLKQLNLLSEHLYLTTGFYKAVTKEKLRDATVHAKAIFESPEQGFKQLQQQYANTDACLIIVGSVFLSGVLREVYLNL